MNIPDGENFGAEARHAADTRPPGPTPSFAFQHRSIYDLARAFDYAFEAVDAIQDARTTVVDAKEVIGAVPNQLNNLLKDADKRLIDALYDFTDETKLGSGAYMMHRHCLGYMKALEKETDRVFQKAVAYIHASADAEVKRLRLERAEIESQSRQLKAAALAATQLLTDMLAEKASNVKIMEKADQELQKLNKARSDGFWSYFWAYW